MYYFLIGNIVVLYRKISRQFCGIAHVSIKSANVKLALCMDGSARSLQSGLRRCQVRFIHV